IKSDEEIALIRRAAAMQDAQWAKVVTVVKPGMRDSEVTALAQYEGELLGSEQGLFRCSSAPLGEPAILRGRHYQGRTMRAGDYMRSLTDTNARGGHSPDPPPTFVWGRAAKERRAASKGGVGGQRHRGKTLKMGPTPAEIYASHNQYMTGHGAPPELRLFGH